jgi:NAD(P)-dependent dehydrogenase (short-subunit alcohol dehydrogenase family)
MESLSDRVALVTGASGGIGRAIALDLARLGARVCLVGRTVPALAKLQAEIGDRALAFACDVGNDAHVAVLPDQVAKATGPIDVLIHSAAVYHQQPLETAPVADFDEQYRINLRAPYLLTQHFLPQLKQRRGQVVFINSSTGVNARPGVSQYAAVKHGLKGLADALRFEVAPAGIRVISVYPGQTATAMQQRRHQIEGKPYDPANLIQPADVASAVSNAVTMPRSAEVTDVHIRPRIVS